MLWIGWLTGCPTTDGPVGTTTLAVVNGSDQALTMSYEQGPIAPPEVLGTDVPGGSTVDVLRLSGCFGCSDPPELVAARFTLALDDGTVVVDLNPPVRADWTSAPPQTDDAYQARFTHTVTQEQVDAASQR